MDPPEGLPEECLPTTKRRGKYSYTLSDKVGRRVDVLLRNRAFYIKADSAGRKVPST